MHKVCRACRYDAQGLQIYYSPVHRACKHTVQGLQIFAQGLHILCAGPANIMHRVSNYAAQGQRHKANLVNKLSEQGQSKSDAQGLHIWYTRRARMPPNILCAVPAHMMHRACKYAHRVCVE